MAADAPSVGGRVLLVDPDGRVLLVRQRAGATAPWLAPGGGTEPGEPPRDVAIRETYEQTGIRADLAVDAAEVTTSRRSLEWSGVTYEQTDHLFHAGVPAGSVIEPVALTDLDWQWWSVEQLRASDEEFEPAHIADLVERLCTVPRTAGRVLLLDSADRVLLIENYVDLGAESTHWITPGGGAEPGETPARAAVRELREEVGIDVALAETALPVHVDRERFTFNATSYDQTNHYFLVRLAEGTRLHVAGVDEIERAVLVGERWWSLAELRTTTATVYPVGLADLLEGLLSAERSASA